MAKKRPRKQKKGRKSKRRAGFGLQLVKSLTSFFVLVALVAVAGWLTHVVVTRKARVKPVMPEMEQILQSTKKPPPAARAKPTQSLDSPSIIVRTKEDAPHPYEIYGRETPLHDPLERIHPDPQPTKRGKPRVALIIDDVGYNQQIAEGFLKLDAVLTFAVFPHSPHCKTIARMASTNGTEIMLHLPMEPLEYPKYDPGPGVLLSSMNPAELVAQLEANLDSVPGAIGVNNHMGSKLTADADAMTAVLSLLKERNLFFIDSRTTKHSRARASARRLGIPFAERNVFLDHSIDAKTIEKEIDRLIKIADRKGVAVGIGHPYRATLEALRRKLPELKNAVHLVPASVVVDIVG